MSAKEIRRIVDHIEPQGVNVTRTTKGLLLRLPDGNTEMIHFTTSDHRAYANTRAKLHRAGVTLPSDRHAIKLPNYISSGTITRQTKERATEVLAKMGNPMRLTAQEFMEAGGAPNMQAAPRVLFHMGWLPDKDKKGSKGKIWMCPIEDETEPIDPSHPEPEETPVAETEPAPEAEQIPEPLTPPVSIAPVPRITPFDSANSWPVDLDSIDDNATLWQLRTLYEASGLNVEVRISRKVLD
jgi:hypothetical protein